MPSYLTGILTFLHTQANALFANLGDVAADRPEPARQVLVSTVITAAVIWLFFKIAKKFGK